MSNPPPPGAPETPARTRHRDAAGRPRFTNALAREASPYLRQHAHNPVDWRPWGEAAFAEARARDVPVFLSVGYSTCHWCHVMEHESFEDLEIATVLNEGYVPIKVDREERPDVDAVFMAFVQATSGHGGWPMSVWLTPQGRPLFGGTYFPARDGDRGPHRGFLTLLRALSEVWRDPRFQGQADEVLAELGKPLPPAEGALEGPVVLDAHATVQMKQYDARRGGFGSAPKFPRPAVLEALLRQGLAHGDAAAVEAVRFTFERMACGGIYDHVGGGFARYSVDAQWLVPHFEKMLYDNAQLILAGVDLWSMTRDEPTARVVHDVIDWLMREMSHPLGGFWSATDADSLEFEGPEQRPPADAHMHEGLFFLWTPAELGRVLDPQEAAWVAVTFDVTPRGNFEGRSILNLKKPLTESEATRWAPSRERLRAFRAQRPPPALDDKVLASWNGLAIEALVRAGAALGEPAYVTRAARAADFVFEALWHEGRLYRTWRDHRGAPEGVLEDYAALTAACLALLEVTGEVRWLDRALALVGVVEARFADPAGGWFRTPVESTSGPTGPRLLFREKPDQDGAEPSGNATMAAALVRLAAITGEARWRERAEAATRSLGILLRRAPQAAPKLVGVLDALSREPPVLVIVTPPGETTPPWAMIHAAASVYVPDRVTLWSPEGGPLAGRLACFAERGARDGRTTAYLCVGTRCELPTADPEAVRARLRAG